MLLLAGVAHVIGEHCELGRHLSTVAPGSDAEANMMENVFATKATNTLKRRVGSFSRFFRWSQLKGMEAKYMFKEDNVYNYVEELRAVAAPTSPGSFLESLGFAFGLLGLDVDLGTVRSARVNGAAVRAFNTKRLKRQAPALKVAAVTAMEILVCNPDAENVIRERAGACLLAVHGSARCADLCGATHEPTVETSADQQVGYIDLLLERTKTSNAKRRRRVPFPLVAPAVGVSGLPWGAAWVNLRAKMGRNAASDGS